MTSGILATLGSRSKFPEGAKPRLVTAALLAVFFDKLIFLDYTYVSASPLHFNV